LGYAHHTGASSQRDKDDRERAAALRAVAQHQADSITLVFQQRFDSSAKASAATIKQKDAAVNQATRQTNATLDQASTARLAAERLLSDSSANIGQLRGALQSADGVIDSLTANIQTERQAATEARLARDSTNARQVALLQRGFTQTLAARDSAAKAVGLAFAADLRDARGTGLRVGRIEGVTAGALLVGALVYLVKQ